jgi:hypothetical protein
LGDGGKTDLEGSDRPRAASGILKAEKPLREQEPLARTEGAVLNV